MSTADAYHWLHNSPDFESSPMRTHVNAVHVNCPSLSKLPLTDDYSKSSEIAHVFSPDIAAMITSAKDGYFYAVSPNRVVSIPWEPSPSPSLSP